MAVEVGRERHRQPAIEFSCGRCSKRVKICRCCWRNQKYCSQKCSHEAKLTRHRHNQKTYRTTITGRENHIAQQKAYRAQKKIQE